MLGRGSFINGERFNRGLWINVNFDTASESISVLINIPRERGAGENEKTERARETEENVARCREKEARGLRAHTREDVS